MRICQSDTFQSAGDVHITIVVQFPDITGVQPAVIAKSFVSLVFVVQVTHEDVTTMHAHLPTSHQQRINFIAKKTEPDLAECKKFKQKLLMCSGPNRCNHSTKLFRKTIKTNVTATKMCAKVLF